MKKKTNGLRGSAAKAKKRRLSPVDEARRLVARITPGDWELRYDDTWSGGIHEISMATALGDANGWQPQHKIKWEHGFYPEDGEQWREAKANAEFIAASPRLVRELLALLQATSSATSTGHTAKANTENSLDV